MSNVKKKSRKGLILGILAVFLCVILIGAGVATVFFRNKLQKLSREGYTGDPNAVFSYEEEENLDYGTINDIESADSIKELIKTWATNGGEKLYSKNVINVLLIGEDDEDDSHRSDSTMLVSVNVKTQKITLTSFLRDSYTYMNIDGQDRYDKTNHSYAWGGPEKLMEVLSDNYKIEIDHYVSINYESFVEAVDALGGIRVDVTEAEARYMNRTTKMKGFESGEDVLLDGKHALVFARIRYLDGEVERTERQRRLIEALIETCKGASLSDLNEAIDRFLPYVATNINNNELLSLGTQAISEGWLEYEIASDAAPSEENRAGVEGFRTYTGYLFVWIVDYIREAQSLQMKLYGQSNIEIDELNHISAADLAKGSLNNFHDEEETTEEETEENDDYGEYWSSGFFEWDTPTIPSIGDDYGIDISLPFGDNSEETTTSPYEDIFGESEESTTGGYDDPHGETDEYYNGQYGY